MEYRPYSYQKEAIDFLLGRKYAILMMEEGLGTPVVTLSVIHKRQRENREEKTLIVTAASDIAEKWISEMEKWNHLQKIAFSAIHGNKKEKQKGIEKEATIYFVSYDNLSWIHKNGLWKFHNLIIDNLSAYKSEKTKRFQTMMAVREYADRIIGITSFPAQDQLWDLHGELKVMDGGKRLGESKAGFFERYYFTNYIWDGSVTKCYRELKQGAVEAVRNKISDICFIPDSKQYPDIPQVVFQNRILELELGEHSKYHYVKMGLSFALMEKEKEMQEDGDLIRLMQMSNGTVCNEWGKIRIFHTKKLDALKKIVAEMEENILVAYWFVHDKDIICEMYPEAKPLETYRDFMDWNAGKIRLGLLNPATGGGRKLCYGGNRLVWFSLPWSASLYKRTICRMRSVRGDCPLFVIHLVVKDTMDEVIMEKLKEKMACMDLFADKRERISI